MRSLIAAAAVAAFALVGAADDKKKGTTVELGGLKSVAPADWKEEAPSSTMRLTQFKLPAAPGDDAPAELAIFFFKAGSGTVEANLKRQEAKFELGKDKKPEVKKIKVGPAEATYQDIQGTFLKKFPPFDPNAKITRMENYRQLYVVFETADGQFYMTLLGPAKTVEKHKKEFDTFLANFK